MSSERLERNQEVVRDSTGVVFSNYPIHFAGMCIFARNDSNNNSVIRVHESADGTTWSLVLLSTHTTAGLASVTIVGLSYQAILFTSDQKYVRISLAASNPEGVHCSLAQYPPKARIPASDLS